MTSIESSSTCCSVLAKVANILLNRILVSSDAAVAGMGITRKINMVACYILLGLSSGIQLLIGYNYGTSNQKRLMSVFKFSFICAIVIDLGLTAVMKR